MMAMMIAFALAAGFTLAGTAKADAQTRSLKIHYIHTKESAEITYMRNGRYVQSGLDQLNHFLRDWRRNEPTKMDPRLFDILWEIYRQTGATDHIHVVSAYRSPATNAMLRSRSSGVAENSQHTLGKAIDFYIPGVQLSRLRAAALRIHGGGVGFYPRSGAPFIHVDVGSVRHWPRMNRNDLMAVFPDGKTIHVPSDGRALPGFQQAKAEYDARQRGGGSIQVADDRSSGSGGGGGGLLAALFGNNRANNAAPAGEATQPARATATAQAPRPQQAVTPQPQAPVAAPETIIAALPERAVPVPLAAPRPSVGVGEVQQATPAAQPQLAGLAAALPEAVPAAPVVPAAEEGPLLASIPVPSFRPVDAPVAAEALQQVASADAAADLPVSAIAGALPQSMGSEAISELLAQSGAEARAAIRGNTSDAVVAAVMPTQAPRVDELRDALQAATSGETLLRAGGEEMIVLASLPDPSAGSQALSSEARNAIEQDAATRERKLAALSASSEATPRVAVINRGNGQDAIAALDSGVRTTGKSARPGPETARRERRPVVVPVPQEMARWALAPRLDAMPAPAGDTSASASARDIVHTAPRQVYMTGFRATDASANANRFTGKAVEFISVARFE